MGTVIVRPGGRLLRAGVVIGLLAALAAGCEIFKPARPEAGGGGEALLPNYAEPESCLYYMRVGIERKDNAGMAAYLGALADTVTDGVGFHAFFDLADWNAYTGDKPTDWDLSHETQFLSVFIRVTGDPYQMEWTMDTFHPYDDIVDEQNRVLHRKYEVWALRQSTGETLLIAVGYADLWFRRISASRWALIRWNDRVDQNVGSPPADPLQLTFGTRRLNAGAGG